MARPRLMMLDEPSLGLAPKVVESVLQLIKALNADGMTVLVVEQNGLHALRRCHRAYVLENWRIVLAGTRAELMVDERLKRA